jgi:alkylation response protein AidB-like acyl-CoA dehydrogenase
VSGSEEIVAETARRIFSDLGDPRRMNQLESAERRQAELWRALVEAGLTLAWVPEQQGGGGAGLADGFAVIRVAGQFASAAPLAETLLAGWLLARAGMSSPAGAMTVAPMRPQDRVIRQADGSLCGRARGISFARDSSHLAVLLDGDGKSFVALVETAACRITQGRSLAGDALDDVTFDSARPIEASPAPDFDHTSLMLMGAAARSVAISGALESALDLSVNYANERVAFERPIGKFQAVQHGLARLAGEAAAAIAASGSAADAIASCERFDDSVLLEVASAKIRSAEAAQEGAAIAHQIHGAIGFTKEHVLHRFTLRMLSWRDDFGNESHWAAALGSRLAARGGDELWPLLASR